MQDMPARGQFTANSNRLGGWNAPARTLPAKLTPQ